jgi:hypothetical protein
MEPEPFRKKAIFFAEHPVLWGGVGVIIGGAAAQWKLAWLFGFGAICFCISIWRSNFWERCSTKWLRFTGNCLLCFVAVILTAVAWYLTPKPKEPPTAEENARAVVALLGQHTLNAQPEPPKPQAPTTPPPVRTHKPLTKQQPEKPTETTTSPKLVVPPSPQVASLLVTQQDDVSTDKDNPFKANVIVQTTQAFPSLNLALECDGPIDHGRGGFTGMLIGVRQGTINGHSNVYVFTYQSAVPQFGPANPLRISLWSKTPIRCEKASTF